MFGFGRSHKEKKRKSKVKATEEKHDSTPADTPMEKQLMMEDEEARIAKEEEEKITSDGEANKKASTAAKGTFKAETQDFQLQCLGCVCIHCVNFKHCMTVPHHVLIMLS